MVCVLMVFSFPLRVDGFSFPLRVDGFSFPVHVEMIQLGGTDYALRCYCVKSLSIHVSYLSIYQSVEIVWFMMRPYLPFCLIYSWSGCA